MIASTAESQLRRCLKGVQYLTSKQDLIQAAISNSCAAEDTVDALRATSPVNLCERHAGGRISIDCRHRWWRHGGTTSFVSRAVDGECVEGLPS